MNQQQISEIAGLLRTAEQQGVPCAPVRERILEAAGDTDPVACAYAIQQLNAQRRLAGGARVVGRKIGLTSTAVQQQLGVDSPDFGMLFADMAYGDGEEIPMARTLQPKVEAEIALVLARDLDF
ncbi:MAG: 2-keto-4-pentenoate hydratase, partial [Lysobacteraceae bacterium]